MTGASHEATMMETIKRRAGLIGLLALSGVALAGCGGGGSDTPASTGAVSSATLSNGLTLSLTVDSSLVPVGGKVNFTTALTNNTDATITATYFSSVNFGPGIVIFGVTDSEGESIGSDGKPFIPPPGTKVDDTVTLQPGESLTKTRQYTFTKADSYAVSAQILNLSVREPGAGPLTVKVGG